MPPHHLSLFFEILILRSHCLFGFSFAQIHYNPTCVRCLVLHQA